MRLIKKRTAAGETMIQVSVTPTGAIDTPTGAIDDVRAYVGGREIGQGYAPLRTPRVVNGKTIVAACGNLGLTSEDVEAIKAALAIEREEWRQTPEGIAARESMAKWDRVADRNEEVARESDINKWRDA